MTLLLYPLKFSGHMHVSGAISDEAIMLKICQFYSAIPESIPIKKMLTFHDEHAHSTMTNGIKCIS